MARIPADYPLTPDASEYNVAHPVYARTVGQLGEVVKGGLGFRWLRTVSTQCELGLASRDYGTIANLQAQYNHRWVLSPLARYVYLGIWCYAEDRATPPPSIAATLQYVAGVAIDGPITWSRANGLLPVSQAYAVNALDFGGATGDRDTYLDTGWSSVAVAGAGTPRMFDAGAGLGGTAVEVELTCSSTRIYSITTIEAYQEDV